MILFAEAASLRVADTASFAVDPTINMDAIGGLLGLYRLGCLRRLAFVHHSNFFWKEDQVFIQWEHKFNGSWSSMGAWQAEEAEEVQRSEAEEWTTPASAVYFFSSWESRIAGGCRGVPACTRATEKCGQPLVGGYRLGVGHICCKYSWNFWIFVLLPFGVNLRDESRKFKWECTILTISCFW